MPLTPTEFAQALDDALLEADPADRRTALIALFEAESLTTTDLALKAAQLVAQVGSRLLFGPESAVIIATGLADIGGAPTSLSKITGTGPVTSLGPANLANPMRFGSVGAETTFTYNAAKIVTPDGEDLVVGANDHFVAQYLGESSPDVPKWKIQGFGQGPAGEAAYAFATAAEIAAGAVGDKLVTPAGMTAAAAPQALTYGGTVAWNMGLRLNAVLTLTGATAALAEPTNFTLGLSYILEVVQDATGGRALTYDACYDFGAPGPPNHSTSGPNARDLVALYCYDAETPLFRASVHKGA